MAFRTLTFSSRMDSLSVRTGGSIARLRQDLKQMVLHDVADGAGLVVERAAALNPEVSAIVICTLSTWSRFQNGSRKELAKRKKSMLCTGRLPEVVVDAEDRRLVEGCRAGSD